MIPEISVCVLPLLDGQFPSELQVEHAVAAIMSGKATEPEIAAFLTAMRCRGETAGHLTGAARAMRAAMSRIPCQSTNLLDTCGTGGDNLHTFNISTASAIAAASAGAKVAKHGNRSVSSSSGSADVLEALGVSINLTPEQVARCIDEIGIGFCFAPQLHPAMKYAGPVRRLLGFRTLFNQLGPLTNPAGAQYQLLGASRTEYAEKLAQALFKLGTDRALVVCGNNELDEVSLWGTTQVFEVSRDQVQSLTWTAADFGLSEISPASLRVDSPSASASLIQRVFQNEPGPARDIVIANAGAALLATGQVQSPREGADRVRHALAEGRTQQKLTQLIETTRRVSEPAA